MAKKCMISTLLSQTDSGPHVGRVRTDTMQGGRRYWQIQLCVYGVRREWVLSGRGYWQIQLCVYGVRKGVGVEW